MTTAFISYKSEYRPFAQQVCDFLRGLGYQTWFDVDDIRKGDYFRDAIQHGLESCQTVIGIITPEALESREVLTEWDFAFSSKGEKRLLLIRYKPADLPYWLRGVQYIDFVGDEKRGFDQLAQALSQPDTSTYTSASPPDLARRVLQPIVYRPPIDGKITLKDREKRDREQILYNLYQSWITGVLYKNVEQGMFAIKSQLRADAVLKTKDYSDYTLPDGSIGQIFEDMNGQLLILGKPGAGKTILLLQLAETLLGQAQADDKQPLPLVFNLSSWAGKGGDLGDWLADEMRRNYGIPKKNGNNRLERNQITLLLDGLDEVAESARDACVNAINAYRDAHKNLKIAVCSRIGDYEALTKKLDVNGAILLEDLSDAQIADYLAGDDHIGTRDLIEREPVAKAMAGTPFLLNAMKSAYQGAPYRGNPNKQLKLDDDRLETRRDHLMGQYVDMRLTGDPNSTRHFLGWMAWQMTKNDRIVFNIEDLQPYDLPEKFFSSYGIYCRISSGLFFGLISGIVSVLIFGLIDGFSWGIVAGQHIGVIFLLLGSLTMKIRLDLFDNKIKIVDRLAWKIERNILILISISGLIFLTLNRLTLITILTLISVLSVSLSQGVTRSESAILRLYPNEGIRRSGINALILALFVCLVTILIFTTLLYLYQNLFFWFFIVLSLGIGLMLTFGLIGWLNGGGETVIQHTALRIILWRAKLAPLNYAKFLIHCAELGVLRQVGGGFIFRHRYLQEYFAQEWDKAHPSA